MKNKFISARGGSAMNSRKFGLGGKPIAILLIITGLGPLGYNIGPYDSLGMNFTDLVVRENSRPLMVGTFAGRQAGPGTSIDPRGLYGWGNLRPLATGERPDLRWQAIQNWYILNARTGARVGVDIKLLTLVEADAEILNEKSAKTHDGYQTLCPNIMWMNLGVRYFVLMVREEQNLIEGMLGWMPGEELIGAPPVERFDCNQAIFIWRIDTFARDEYGSQDRKFKGAGKCLIARVVAESIKQGYGGKIFLGSTNHEFFLAIGMTRWDTTNWFYFTEDRAQKFLADFFKAGTTNLKMQITKIDEGLSSI